MSLATVYRNLRRLAAEGLLQERVEVTGLRFDPNVEPTITSPAWLAGGSSTSRVAIVPGADGRRMLPSWLHYYNCHRTHRSLGGAAPISRLPTGYNLVGTHS